VRLSLSLLRIEQRYLGSFNSYKVRLSQSFTVTDAVAQYSFNSYKVRLSPATVLEAAEKPQTFQFL